LIDTGSDICIVEPAVVQQLGLPQGAQQSAQSTLGSGVVVLHEASVILHGPGGVTGLTLARPDWIVMAAGASMSQHFEMVIGLDILRDCLLIADWPGGTFTLSF
jgi:hypothetical protein